VRREAAAAAAAPAVQLAAAAAVGRTPARSVVSASPAAAADVAAAAAAAGAERLLRSFAVGQPHVVDRMLDRMQAGARRVHPACEDALDLALQRDLVRLDESVRVRGFGRRPRVAGPRGDLQRAKLHGLIDRHIERDDAAGDLVEPGEHGRVVRDLLRRRRDHDFLVLRRRYRRCGRLVGLRARLRRAARLPLSRC